MIEDSIQIVLILFTGIFLGYTALPMPKYLGDLFNNSNIFKFFILTIVGTLSNLPFSKEKLVIVSVGSVVILGVLELLRRIEGTELI